MDELLTDSKIVNSLFKILTAIAGGFFIGVVIIMGYVIISLFFEG